MLLLQLVVNFPQQTVAKELVALAINLSLDRRNADLLCRPAGLRLLMARAMKVLPLTSG